MKSLSKKFTVVALIGAFSLYAHGNTNSWGQILYTRYQESKVYYAPTISAIVLKTLVANETVKADFKDGKWYAIFKPSETVRGIENVVGYMEEADLFPSPLPAGQIKGGIGDAPPIANTVEGMKPVPQKQKSLEFKSSTVYQTQPTSLRPSPITAMDIPSFYCKSRDELASIFPGSQNTISPFREWKKVRLDFNGKGCLAQITLWPHEPTPLQQVQILSEKYLGVFLRDERGSINSQLCSFRIQGGLIRTVNCDGTGKGKDSFLVDSISYFYNVEWSEDMVQGFERTKREYEAINNK